MPSKDLEPNLEYMLGLTNTNGDINGSRDGNITHSIQRNIRTHSTVLNLTQVRHEVSVVRFVHITTCQISHELDKRGL